MLGVSAGFDTNLRRQRQLEGIKAAGFGDPGRPNPVGGAGPLQILKSSASTWIAKRDA
jgi:hypothetical protein